MARFNTTNVWFFDGRCSQGDNHGTRKKKFKGGGFVFI